LKNISSHNSSMKTSILVLGLCVFLFFFTDSTLGQASGGVCKGTVGSFQYDLSGLALATGGVDQTCQDSGSNTYLYRPCKALQQTACQTTTDSTPAACQKDTRKIPQYHDCGSTAQIQWWPRAAGDGTGFFIQFNGGQEDRRLDVEFICDRSAGTGQLEASNPTEQPTHFYHLRWTSKYACPTNNPPPSGILCCQYATSSGESVSTCNLAVEGCPSSLGTYSLTGSNNSTNCSECASPRWTCCAYETSDSLLATQCLNTAECPKYMGDNDLMYKNVGNFTVTSCSHCFAS